MTFTKNTPTVLIMATSMDTHVKRILDRVGLLYMSELTILTEDRAFSIRGIGRDALLKLKETMEQRNIPFANPGTNFALASIAFFGSKHDIPLRILFFENRQMVQMLENAGITDLRQIVSKTEKELRMVETSYSKPARFISRGEVSVIINTLRRYGLYLKQ